MIVVFLVMAHISGDDRSQLLLLLDSVDDYVGPDNVVRFIDAFVDGLNLQAAGFGRVQPKATGRPGYDPADLLKLYIYGYLNRVRSSRRLEVETRRNIEVIWLLRRLTPDFKTIADFRRDNRSAFRQVFREFVVLCREHNFTKAKLARAMADSDERLARYLKQLDDADKDEKDSPEGNTVEKLQEKIAAIHERRERLEGHGKALAESGEDQISLTDPDARAMHSSSRIGVDYNIQIAVDTKHKLIAEQQVHNKVSDLGLLAETAAAARENLGVDKIDAVADRGYFKIEDIEACEAASIVPYVPKPQRGPAVAKGFFTKDQFRYDAKADTYTCPGGESLRRASSRPVRDGVRLFNYINVPACKTCALKARCTDAGSHKVTRYENEAVLERMDERLAAQPGVLDERRESVEHPFGSVKQWMGQGAFLTRRLENVRAEFSLTAIAYNLRRAITLVGIPALIAAVRP